jgi:hypothetical protein
MEILEKKMYLIPLEHREQLIEMLPWFRKTMRLIKGHEYTNYLFELYRTYLCKGYTGSQNCSACMMQVKSRMFLAAKTFEKYGTGQPADG